MSQTYQVPKCPKCSSMDVSINIDDNSIECAKCKYAGLERASIDLQEFREDMEAKESEKLQDLINKSENVHLDGLYGKGRH